jgi:lipoprotein-anchoring transpeptidase ErfK/SrfK
MRRLALLFAALVALILSDQAAHAGVVVQINKFSQRMTVSVDGRSAYVWPVSTGRGGFGTPAGRFRPQWLARRWFSTRYYGSPMPYSIFFHKGYAIHGTNYISRLGGPASHGCVRLHPAHAATLFALVQRVGLSNTSIVIGGANPAVLVKRRARSAQATY